jgi:hypothetical protein
MSKDVPTAEPFRVGCVSGMCDCGGRATAMIVERASKIRDSPSDRSRIRELLGRRARVGQPRLDRSR